MGITIGVPRLYSSSIARRPAATTLDGIRSRPANAGEDPITAEETTTLVYRCRLRGKGAKDPDPEDPVFSLNHTVG
jgi:hypothetical protein